MRPHLPRLIVLIGGIAALWPTPGNAQVIIIDRRPDRPVAGSFEVKKVALDARVRDQVAEVQISQTFHNPSSATIQSEYLFPIPEDGAVQDMVLLVDGKELPGKLLDKDEARRIYEEIVRRKQDPALLEYVGRGLFRTSVFPIPPGADRTVTLKYTQLLKRDGSVIELNYPFGTQKFSAKPIERLELTARIESKDEIKSLYSPGHDVEIDRHGDHEATIRLTQRDVVPTADFRLLMTLRDGDVGGSVVSYRPSGREDGYLLLLASPRVERPRDEKPTPKTVRLRARPLGIDGGEEDRAGPQLAEVRPRQPPRRRPVQHHRLRRPRRHLQAGAATLRFRGPPRGRPASSTTSAPAAARTSPRPSKKPSPSSETPSAQATSCS